MDQAEGLRRLHKTATKVITVASGKGGVGKTNVVANLAVSLARAGNRVMVFDADLGLGNIDILLGLTPRYNISHVLSGEKTLEQVLVRGPHDVWVLPAASGVSSMAALDAQSQARLIDAVSGIDLQLDYLLVDCAAGISGDVLTFSRAAQYLIVVLSNEPASVADAYALIKVLSKQYGQRRFHLLPNMVRDAREGQTLFAKIVGVTDRYLDVSLDLVGTIPLDPALRAAVRAQRAVVESAPQSPAAAAFDALASRVRAWPVPKGPGGQLEFFMAQWLQAGQPAAPA
ncbi:flagellum site-determining protein YlxH [mine drainage metagenome]|uniref:Flagellum site-determining protein YlxH n=1 Tax=mine drainage metagenome TaxID=410659 RepID=A0A1J5RLA8_9ZZZZ|nr:MinD/ParA family protein [Thiomonas sp.]MDE2129282.1 MinD/ParA family protein [Betaproteobacteria bacterium]OZB45800.1 MAG: cobyrinic acid a,c-diamide synthase [Thiomonas sp. 15-66-11]